MHSGQQPSAILYYIHDPMCSWCWGFRNSWVTLQQQLPETIQLVYLLGGLARDNDEPMSDEMQINIRDTWRAIQKEIPGTEFNYDFWQRCKPRRSTYPACRAIIAARQQDAASAITMLLAIQQAYYLHAQNPSDDNALIELASNLGLDKEKFADDMNAASTVELLEDEFNQRRNLKVTTFPSLVLKLENKQQQLDIDYNHPEVILKQIQDLMNSNG